jgi:hypothetical protein
MTYDDVTAKDVHDKIDRLRNDSLIDIENRLQLWRATLQLRRATIRNQSITEILAQFPGYKESILVIESLSFTLL